MHAICKYSYRSVFQSNPYLHCKGNHAANDKRCPSYLLEVQLQKYKSQNHLTIQERRHQFQAQKNLWQHNMLQSLLVLLWKCLLNLNSNEQFLSYLWNSQIPLRWCSMKCNLQSIYSWSLSPRLWWLLSKKCTEVKYLSSCWLSFSQLWSILPKSLSFQRNTFAQWIFLVSC